MSIFDVPIESPTIPTLLDPSKISLVAFDLEFNNIIQTKKAREQFLVDGAGLTVAVFDTGINSEHECFAGRVTPGKNFSTEGESADTSDHHGHGTNVAGLIGGRGVKPIDPREGIATAVRIMPIKVLPGTFLGIAKGLKWVIENAEQHNISAVNLSLGLPQTNYSKDSDLFLAESEAKDIATLIHELAVKRIAVIIAAGNDYANFNAEGMAFPAIIRQCISVGAVYDSSQGRRDYRSGASATSTSADQITPFTQRLAEDVNGECFTTIFAPGAAATSAGIGSTSATSVQDGTSQAAPTVTGVILLVQQFILRQSGALPEISLLKNCLRSTTQSVRDSDLGVDNVRNTDKTFPRLNAFDALVAAQSSLTVKALGESLS